MKLACALLVASACTGQIEPNGGLDDNAPDAGVTAPDADPTNPAVARGQLWVDAKVPYCQAPNHKPDADADCSATCTRPDNAAWDPYRSDCSGFVSWAWGLPAPGHTTHMFAPFMTDITDAIEAEALVAGDAVNNETHMMLFKAWVTPGKTATFMDEPGCSSTTPYAHEFTADVTLDGQKIVILHHGTFTAIRYTK